MDVESARNEVDGEIYLLDEIKFRENKTIFRGSFRRDVFFNGLKKN